MDFQTLISKLQFLQNRAAKTVLQGDYYSLSRACLDRLHWLPVALRAQFKLLWLTAHILYFNQRLTYMIFFLSDRLMSLSGFGTLVYGCINLSFLALFRISPFIYGILFHFIYVFQLPLKISASV